jgi:hypothetical protein
MLDASKFFPQIREPNLVSVFSLRQSFYKVSTEGGGIAIIMIVEYIEASWGARFQSQALTSAQIHLPLK